ncbi:MAG: hypothetical protein JWP81_3435 [Ferruginibacter sp.]|nr:hypothetical protein [Ferruginibacter sp.]
MRKIIFHFLLLLSPCLMRAQTAPTQEQQKALFNKVDRLVANYIKYSSFLEPGRPRVSANSLNNFKQLFIADNISIPDEMSPLHFDENQAKPVAPSFNTMEKGTIAKGKLPVFNANYVKSFAAMKQYQEALKVYLEDIGRQQYSFYEAYNQFLRNLAAYNSSINRQENIATRKLPEFLSRVEANYPDGFSVRMLNSAVSFKNIDHKEIDVLLEKSTEGEISGTALKLQNHDTLLLTLQVSEDYSIVKIAGIEMLGHQLNFLNDKDRDFVVDGKDACPTDRAIFSANGCPFAADKNLETKINELLAARRSDSLTAIAALLEANSKKKVLEDRVAFLESKLKEPAHTFVTIGLSGGPVSGTLANADNAYLNNIRSNEINPSTQFSGGTSVNGDVMLEQYFGARATFGIGIGISYASISGTVKKNSFHVEYQANDKANHIFRQHITATTPIEEKIAISSLAVPIVLAVKTDISEKITLKLLAGLSFNLSYTSKMNSNNGSFDYEAVYQYTSNNTTVFDDRQTPNEASWLITKNFVTNHVGSAGVPAYFSGLQANHYPVALDVEASSQSVGSNGGATFGSGIGFIIMPSISYNFNKQSSFSLGGYYSATSLPQTGNDYRLMDENYHYSTLMQGVSKMSNSNFGIRLSYTHSLFYNLPKWIKELSGIR